MKKVGVKVTVVTLGMSAVALLARKCSKILRKSSEEREDLIQLR